MQKDMHFHGTYAIARISGFTPDEARTIATAAQFVDEAVAATPVNLGGQSYMLPVVSAHEMLEVGKNSDEMDQWKVWLPFHFLPGGVGANVEERLVCLWGEPGNRAVDAVIEFTLGAAAGNQPYALHLLGIVTHVIQDTYAHYGFSGVASDLNKVDQASLRLLNASEGMADYIHGKLDRFRDRLLGSFADATRLGHAGTATCPDRPYLEWEFRYETGRALDVGYLRGPRKNAESFYAACTRLYAFYSAFREGRSSIDAPGGHLAFDSAVEKVIRGILESEGRLEERCEMWRDGIAADVLFPRAPGENDVRYSGKGWSVRAMVDNPLAASTDAHKYNWAARLYLNKIHDDILPQMGILMA